MIWNHRAAIVAHSIGIIVLLSLGLGPAAQGQDKPIPVTGPADADLAPFDDMMLAFLRDNQVPGAALAVTKNGRLVYARGFGHADPPQLGLTVQPTMRFRIASISKPITAAAILKLIEMGLLKLDDHVFALLGITLPANADERLRKVTIKHLLHHTGGWDRDKSFDPMFRPILIAREQKVPPPAKPLDIIHYMTHQKLDFEPGARYAYSNFGYCVLGRVIEKVSGQSYEAFVQRHIFDPVGIKRTQLGHTLTTAKNEVKYIDEKNRKANAVVGPDLGKPVPLPYGAWYLEAMDSHGGWISTAPDLLRFAADFDRPQESKILKAASIKTMFAPPEGPAGHKPDGKAKDRYYACGWQIVSVGGGKMNTFHTGSLDGTSTILVRRADGLCWAVLFNTRNNAKGASLTGVIDPLVHEAADKVKRWPNKNLFDKSF